MKYPFLFTLMCGVISLYPAAKEDPFAILNVIAAKSLVTGLDQLGDLQGLQSQIKQLQAEQQSVAALLEANGFMPGKSNYRPLGDRFDAVASQLKALESNVQALLDACSGNGSSVDTEGLVSVITPAVMERLRVQDMSGGEARRGFLAGDVSAQALAERTSFRRETGRAITTLLVQDQAFMEQVARGLVGYFEAQKAGGNRDLRQEVAEALAKNPDFMKNLSETALGRMFGGDLSDAALNELGDDPKKASLEKMEGDSEDLVIRRRASSASRRIQHKSSSMAHLALLLSHNESFLVRVAQQAADSNVRKLKQRVDELELDRDTQRASTEGFYQELQALQGQVTALEEFLDRKIQDMRKEIQRLGARKQSQRVKATEL